MIVWAIADRALDIIGLSALLVCTNVVTWKIAKRRYRR